MMIYWRSILIISVLLLLSYGMASAEGIKRFDVPWSDATKEAARKGYCFVTQRGKEFAVNSGGKASSRLLDMTGTNKVRAQITNGIQLQTTIKQHPTRFFMFADFPKCLDGRQPRARGQARERNYSCSSGIKWPNKYLADGWHMVRPRMAPFRYPWGGPFFNREDKKRVFGFATMKFAYNKGHNGGGKGIPGKIRLMGPSSATTWKQAFKPGGPCR